MRSRKNPTTLKASGLRATIRVTLYEVYKHELGCPKSGECKVLSSFGKKEPCGPDKGCENYFNLSLPPLDDSYLRRMKHLIRLESMINVGCKFGPNDLLPDDWDGLIVLAQERQWMHTKLDEARDKRDKKGKDHPVDSEAQKKIDEQRKELGIPAPGQSIFPRSRPMT